MAARKRDVIEAPQSTELAQCRQGVVNEILVCAWEIVVDYPMEVAFLRRKLDVDVVGVRIDNRGGSPVQIRCGAIYELVSDVMPLFRPAPCLHVL